MATHDYDIANGTGAAVRADINNVLAAIVSNNSSASEPATKYAYQWWADTSTGILKIRNSSNDGWVSLLFLTGVYLLGDGTVSNPSLAFINNNSTGMFRDNSTETLAFATAGVSRLQLGTATIFNEGGNDIDFKIEGDTVANLFYLDASTDRIGIGTATPSTKLDINLGADDSVIATSTDAGSFYQSTDNTGSTLFGNQGASGLISVDPTNAVADSILQIIIDGSEKARMIAAGNLSLGTTSVLSNALLTVQGGTTAAICTNATDAADRNAIVFRNTNGDVGSINTNGSATAYNTSSDYRIKENEVLISDGITRLKTLKPYRFNFKADPTKTVDGFFAHEVTAVPEAITGTKDAVDSDNEPILQGIDQSKLVPLLTAALQEAIAKIETLEAKVAVLEGS
tara:strand:+ start:5207 stop:6403 length:1197 start_codon:yes stop_codon:yes gene_type:complete